MTKIFERTAEGLRDAIFSEMEDIRAGIATPAEATAFALLAKTIVSSIEVEITERLRIDDKEERNRRYHEREQIRLDRSAHTHTALLLEHERLQEQSEVTDG